MNIKFASVFVLMNVLMNVSMIVSMIVSMTALTACTKKAETTDFAADSASVSTAASATVSAATPEASPSEAAAAPADSADAVREIVLETKSIDGAVHWIPDTVEVKNGEKIRFVLKHQLTGGFDFHGFSIPVLKISKQVNRNTDLVVDVEIPADLAKGTHGIACQFHPKHVGSKLVVN